MQPDAVVDNVVVVIVMQAATGRESIGAKQADFVRDRFGGELFDYLTADAIHDASDDIALALHCADDWSFAASATTTLARTLVEKPALILATDVSFIHFNDTAELFDGVFYESSTDLMAHRPCGFVRAEAHGALNLEGGQAFLGGHHHMDNAIPVAKRLVGVFEDRSRDMKEAITAVRRALIALPMTKGDW